MTKFFVLPTFVLFGVAIPWAGWVALRWSGILLAGLVAPPPPAAGRLALARGLHPLKTWKDVGFVVWFGSIDVSMIFYVMLAVQRTGIRRLWPIVSFILFASLVAHGLLATPLSRRMPLDPAAGSGEVDETVEE